jgi:hypothetical protein
MLPAAISVAEPCRSGPTMTDMSLFDFKVIPFMYLLTRDDLQFHWHAISRSQL